MTNLPENEFHTEEIKEIYHLKWGIETSFCTLKHAIAAVNFHTKSRQMITHEIWARLICFNFCFYITGKVTFEKQKRKHIHQVDFTTAFKIYRHFLRLHPGEEPPDVEGLIRKHTFPVRPDRNFECFEGDTASIELVLQIVLEKPDLKVLDFVHRYLWRIC